MHFPLLVDKFRRVGMPEQATFGRLFVMKHMYHTACLLAVAALISSCYRPDEITVEVSTPQLAGRADADLIERALTEKNGINMEMVKTVAFDFDQRLVRVTYNAKLTALKNIQHAIAGAGFQADHIPPRPGSESKRLPPAQGVQNPGKSANAPAPPNTGK
jgi:hypothetical protein